MCSIEIVRILRRIVDMIKLKETCVIYIYHCFLSFRNVRDKTVSMLCFKEIYIACPDMAICSHGGICEKIGWETIYINIFKILPFFLSNLLISK